MKVVELKQTLRLKSKTKNLFEDNQFLIIYLNHQFSELFYL